MPNVNILLTDLMLNLNYKATEEGVCAGISQMWVQAILSNDIGSFNKRLHYIFFNSTNNFKEDFQERQRVLDEIKKIESLENKPDDYKNIIHQLEQKLKDEKFKKVIDVLAFLDGIELYQNARYYSADHNNNNNDGNQTILFDHNVRQQDIPSIAQLTSSIELKKHMGVQVIPKLTNREYYSIHSLSWHLEELTKQIIRLQITGHDDENIRNIAVTLSGNKHRIGLAFDPSVKKWILTDSNELPSKTYHYNNSFQDLTELAKNIFTLLGATGDPGLTITTRTFVTGDHAHIAASQNQGETLTALHEAGFDLNGINRFGHTPTQIAIITNNTEALDALYQANIKFGSASVVEDIPLYFALRYGHNEGAVSLLEYKLVDISFKDSDDNNALHIAAEFSDALVMSSLLSNQDISSLLDNKNANGLTYIDVLIQQNRIDLLTSKDLDIISPLQIALVTKNWGAVAKILINLPNQDNIPPELHAKINKHINKITDALIEALQSDENFNLPSNFLSQDSKLNLNNAFAYYVTPKLNPNSNTLFSTTSLNNKEKIERILQEIHLVQNQQIPRFGASQ